MSQKKVLIGLFIFALSVTVLGFLIARQPARAANEAISITLNMDEYHFTVAGQQPNAPIELKTGQLYDMVIKNTGNLPHEIWWGKEPQMGDEGRLDGYKTNLLENIPLVISGLQGNSAETFEINVPGLDEIMERPGQQFTIEFTLPDSAKGKWELGCFQPMPKAEATASATGTPVPDVPHYMVNMKADLIVK